MKYPFLALLFIACNSVSPSQPKVGDCVIGTSMGIWKLVRIEDGKYLLAAHPLLESSQVKLVEDVSAFKIVDCPN